MTNTATVSPSNAEVLAPRGRGRPKTENVAALTTHIVLVAREVFFELGLGAATMDIIAARARISKETLYKRFKDKRILFEAVIQTTLDAWAEGAANNPVFRARSLEDLVRHNIEIQVKAMLSYEFANISRLIIAEANTFPELGKVMLEKVNPDRINSLAAKIRAFAEIDEIPCRDANSAAEALRGMIGGWVQAIMASGQDFGEAEQAAFVDRVTEIFLASRPVW